MVSDPAAELAGSRWSEPESLMSHTLLAEPVTHGIVVSAVARFSPDDSDADARRFVFRYTIRITNTGDTAARLAGRHWVIIDGNGHREDVDGPGVVGQTPRLKPGETFEYQSFCPLATLWGTMEGSYRMVRDDVSKFDTTIDRFYLRQP
jgi:ApaG protein